MMQPNNKGGDSWGNAQASVEGAQQSLVACDVTAEATDKQHAVPMAQWTAAPLEPAGIERPKDAAGGVETIPGTYDSGSDREAAAEAVEPWGWAPYMATGRQRHQGPEPEAAVVARHGQGAQGRERADSRRASPVCQAHRDRAYA
jgi:hypothetical protein